MEKITTQLLTAFIGSLAFSVVFRLRKKFLLPASIGGVMSWVIYIITCRFTSEGFTQMFFATAAVALYAELLARLFKAPSTVFFVPCVLPLVPGSSLYYTMLSAVNADREGVRSYGSSMIEYAFGIAAGMCLVWAICDASRKIRRAFREKRHKS